jgi:hypothetical protein
MADPDAKQRSFLFGGVGDARHMLRTISQLAKHETDEEIGEKLYHFTVNDINGYAIARDLVVWMLLQDLSETDSDSDEADQVLNTLLFVYLGTMMPDHAFKQLHQTIDKALTALKAGVQPLKWVYLHKEHIPEYLRALTMWKGRALKLYTNLEVIDKITEKMKEMREVQPQFMEITPAVCKKEKLLYLYSTALYPSRRFLKLADPGMQDLLEKFSGKPKANAEKFKTYLREHWHINTTLMSPDWRDAMFNDEDYDLFHDPFEAIHCLYPGFLEDDQQDIPKETEQTNQPTRLFEYVTPFFLEAANAIKLLEGRLQVEVVYGELIDVCEKLRFGLYQKEDEEETEASDLDVRPKGFPVTFDRIHLSNVP